MSKIDRAPDKTTVLRDQPRQASDARFCSRCGGGAMKRRAVMFDLDGTLLNTLEDLGDSVNAALQELHAPPRSYDFYRHAVGDGAEALVRRSLPEDMRHAETVRVALGVARQHYGDHWHNKTRPYEGIPELLDGLRARGVVMAVLSNKPDVDLQNCVRHYFAENTFAIARGVLPGGPIKPDPTAALQIVDALGIPREDWLYVGDTNTDMQTATAAGFLAVGCTWGFRDREELLSNGATAIIDRPEELLTLVGPIERMTEHDSTI